MLSSNKARLVVIVIGFLSLVFFPGQAQSRDLSLGVRIGTLGIAPAVVYKINEKFSVRTMGGYFKKSKSTTSGDVSYDLKVKLFSAGIVADYHPFDGAFRISAGILYDGNKFSGDAKPTEGSSYTINGHVYTLNKLTGRIRYNNKIAPYFGIGWDTAFSKERGLGFVLDLGVMYQGRSKVKLTAYGSSNVLNDPQFQADLAQASDDLKDKANKLRFWPVVMIGLVYKF